MVDIPNTFIKSRLKHKKEIAIIKIRGVPVDIILVIPPYIYDPYVTIDCKGVKQLVVQCQNTIYGTMMASFCTTIISGRALNWRDTNSIPMTHALPTI